MKRLVIFLISLMILGIQSSITKGQEEVSFSLENGPDTTYFQIIQFENQIVRMVIQEYSIDFPDSVVESKIVTKRVDSIVAELPKELDVSPFEVKELVLGQSLWRSDVEYVPESFKFVSKSFGTTFQLKGGEIISTREFNRAPTIIKHLLFFAFLFFLSMGILEKIKNNNFGKSQIFTGVIIILIVAGIYFLMKLPTGLWEWIDGINLLGITGMIGFLIYKKIEKEDFI
jgi:hypothetical protein